MTWFRVGGAGIPASLKSAMNSVLNKKFGTSGQNYPPKGWPDDVNLLGPLPIKTASGAIASFSDGADDVPVKSCKVSFTPSGGGGTPSSPVAITGYTGLTLTNKDNMTTPTQTDTYTDTFGQTIYGGERDLTTGKVKVTWIMYELNGNAGWARYGTTDHSYYYNAGTGNDRPIDQTKLTSIISNIASYNSSAPASAPDWSILVQGGQRIVVTASSQYSDIDDFKTLLNQTPIQIACPASEQAQTEITGLTSHEINTMLGDNNFYADTGNTSVEYRADIDLLLAALQGSRSLSASLMRSASPEEVSEPEENIQNTEETEGESNER